jgi:quercetin dioxygenase-like cupin family protein
MASGMKRNSARTTAIAPAVASASLGLPPGQAHERETVKPVFAHANTNVPGKNLVAVVVSYLPGAKSPAHRHAPSAFIYAHVLTGAIRSRVGDEAAKIYHASEGFYE